MFEAFMGHWGWTLGAFTALVVFMGRWGWKFGVTAFLTFMGSWR